VPTLLGGCPPVLRQVASNCAKTVFHVPDRNGRRCALCFAGFCSHFLYGGRHRTLGAGDVVLDSAGLSAAGITAGSRVSDSLRVGRHLSVAARRSHPYGRPEPVSSLALCPEQWCFGTARSRRLLNRRPDLRPAAFDLSAPAIGRSLPLVIHPFTPTNLNGCPTFAPAYVGQKRRGEAPQRSVFNSASKPVLYSNTVCFAKDPSV
jgi:hypothetical protein